MFAFSFSIYLLQNCGIAGDTSQFIFCRIAGAGDTTLSKLQKLQNRAARVVRNSPFDHSSLPLISKLGWLTVKEMIDFETACMVYKALHGLAPPYMKSMFHKLSESCNRTLRNTSTDLRIPLCKTSNGQRSFSYRGVTVWNQLSLEIKTAPSLPGGVTPILDLTGCAAQQGVLLR